ncbi:MAG: zeta toxin family protein [Armatimonadetes bacterium]|nr:zeta toxin family protein [Armatimonadota bacterium]
MSSHKPQAVILAGPNGSGKSTTALALLAESVQFVNADLIAQEISGVRSTTADLQAGRLLVQELDRIEDGRQSFALETTLATAKLVPRLERLHEDGYEIHLIFMWLRSSDLAVSRVATRVRLGGHDVPEETVRRRYERGLRHFFRSYMKEVDTWAMYDNSRLNNPKRIASGGNGLPTDIHQPELWNEICRQWNH